MIDTITTSHHGSDGITPRRPRVLSMHSVLSTNDPTKDIRTESILHEDKGTGVWPSRESNLNSNLAAVALLSAVDPSQTTLHFTFGSSAMLPFMHNWRHFVGRAGLEPAVVGAADGQMFAACSRENVPALAIADGLDVWTYKRGKAKLGEPSTAVQKGGVEWKYYRHHKSSFLELGLVKVAFLWELVSLRFDVLISDLDVVWLRGGWERWMSHRQPGRPPLREAALLAMADVLVSTDELDEEYDAHGRWERWPFGLGWGWRTDLNTGVVFWRATNGSKAFLQAWRLAMLDKKETENTNDQFVFCDMVRSAKMVAVTLSAPHMDAWRRSLAAHGNLLEEAFASISPNTRGVWMSEECTSQMRVEHPLPTACRAAPCLEASGCSPHRFTMGTLPLRAFTGGHTYFMQRVQNFEGHGRPQTEALTVHFTFQYSDTPDFPHGKRQRAREAGLWTEDPPEYYSQGRFVRLVGALYTAKQRALIERSFPEWSPRRHMHLDAIQRAAVRDLLALSIALNATLIMPPLDCDCDRYWGFTQNCRMPTAPRNMRMPYRCSQDALYEVKRWNDMRVRFREADFLDHPRVPAAIKESVVRLIVHKDAPRPAPGSAEARFTAVMRPGTPMSALHAEVDSANRDARLIEVGTADVKRLCKWLGSTEENRRFNRLQRYVLHESARYCPEEDHDAAVANSRRWNWRNPFTAYNCTWGFRAPADFPEPGEALGESPCERSTPGQMAAMAVTEYENSITCPRVMLCPRRVSSDGTIHGHASRCNLEGYDGLDYDTFGNQTRQALAAMPEGRCPYPPGDIPGQGFEGEREYWSSRAVPVVSD